MQHPRVASRNSARRRTVAGRVPSSSTAGAGGGAPPAALRAIALDGSDDWVQMVPQNAIYSAIHDTGGPGSTTIMLFRPRSTSSPKAVFGVASGSPTLVVGYFDSDGLRWGSDTPSASRNGAFPIVPDVDAWCIYVLVRPPGNNVAIQFSFLQLGESWVHTDSLPSTVTTTSSIPDNAKIGSFNGSGGFCQMDFATGAFLLGPRTTGEIETITNATAQIAALADSSTDLVFDCNGATTSDPIVDLLGSDAAWEESSRTGTTVVEPVDLDWTMGL